jgi:hypothetical protein
MEQKVCLVRNCIDVLSTDVFRSIFLCDKYSLNFSTIYEYMNNNQHDALFIFSLLSYQTSTSFRRISSPSSGVRTCICGKLHLLYFRVYCQRAWQADDSQLKV